LAIFGRCLVVLPGMAVAECDRRADGGLMSTLAAGTPREKPRLHNSEIRKVAPNFMGTLLL
jgi:hypothetical protein